MSEIDSVDPGAVVFEADHLAPGDEVQVARAGYEWTNPLEVQAVDVVEWFDEQGSVAFGTARVELTSPASAVEGQPHIIDVVSGSHAEWRQGEVRDDLVRFRAVDTHDVDDEEDSDGDGGTTKYGGEHPCPGCDRSFGTEHGLNIHRGQVHGSRDELSEQAIEDFEEVAAQKAGDVDTDDEDEVEAEADDQSDGGEEIATKGFADPDDSSDEETVCYPRPCTCGVVCSDSLEWDIHRTEAHESPQSHFGGLEAGEFAELVVEHETAGALADTLGWGTERVLRALGIYGFDGALTGDGLPEDPTAQSDLLTLDANANGREVTSSDA